VNDVAERFYQRNFERLGFESLPEDFARFMADTRAGGQRYSRALAYLESHGGLDVLELGCGDPAVPRALAPLTRSYTVIDVVQGRLGSDPPANLRLVQANLDQDFPVASQSIDVVLAMMVIEHLYDPFHSFAEVARVLRPGGRAFVNLPNIASWRCRVDLLFGRLPWTTIPNWFETREWDGNHLHYFTVASVRRLAEEFGLKLAALHPVGSALWLKRLRPQLFCHEITFEFHR
jgi:SAM-dependent methyltransferase